MSRDAAVLNRMERGRDLTDAEISEYLADRQTAIRHGTADIGTEIAAQLRDRSLAPAASPMHVPGCPHFDTDCICLAEGGPHGGRPRPLALRLFRAARSAGVLLSASEARAIAAALSAEGGPRE